MKRSVNYLFSAIFILFFCFATEAKAETLNTGLRIDEVFRRYARARNVTMVELSKEMLEMYNMRHYRSIAIRNNPEALAFIRECLEYDQRGARKIKEVSDENGIISAYYQLTPTEDGLNRFILFNVNPQNLITLVYIEGDLDSDDLVALLFSL